MTTAELEKWYKEWCKDTGRSGGVLIGTSIKELLIAFDKSKQNL